MITNVASSVVAVCVPDAVVAITRRRTTRHVVTARIFAICVRRAGVGLGRPHQRCHEEDDQQTGSDGGRGARLEAAGMSAHTQGLWGGRHLPIHGTLAAHLHLGIVSILVQYPRSRGAGVHAIM